MRRAVLLSLLWLLLLPVVGAFRLLWVALRSVAWWPMRMLGLLAGLLLVMVSENPVAAQILAGANGPTGHRFATWGLAGVGTLVLYHGVRSRVGKRLWRLVR